MTQSGHHERQQEPHIWGVGAGYTDQTASAEKSWSRIPIRRRIKNFRSASKTVEFLILWEKRHRRGIRELKCHSGGIAMTIPDYIALGVLITLILLGAGRVYLETRRF